MLREEEAAAIVARSEYLEGAALVELGEEPLKVVEAAGRARHVRIKRGAAKERLRRVRKKVGEGEEQRDGRGALRFALLRVGDEGLPAWEDLRVEKVLGRLAGVADIGRNVERAPKPLHPDEELEPALEHVVDAAQL